VISGENRKFSPRRCVFCVPVEGILRIGYRRMGSKN